MDQHDQDKDVMRTSPIPPPYQPPQSQMQAFPPIQQQPTQIINNQPVQQTTVVVQNFQQNIGPRVWSSGLGGCFDDCSGCLCGTFCIGIYGGLIASKLGESSCVPCCVPGGMIALRMKLRTQENIQGSLMNDCCVMTFCKPCAYCQLDREAKFVQNVRVQLRI